MDKPGQTNSSAMAFGWRAYGLGVMAIGVVCLAWRDFEPGEAVPTNLPDRVERGRAVAAERGLGSRGARGVFRGFRGRLDEWPGDTRQLHRLRGL